jgi:hypothetical protein
MDCYLHKTHSPEPLNAAIHHVLPKSWGGPDVESNKVTICPTGHENVHTILNWFVKFGGPDEVPGDYRIRAGSTTWALALRAWEQHTAYTPYTLGL